MSGPPSQASALSASTSSNPIPSPPATSPDTPVSPPRQTRAMKSAVEGPETPAKAGEELKGEGQSPAVRASGRVRTASTKFMDDKVNTPPRKERAKPKPRPRPSRKESVPPTPSSSASSPPPMPDFLAEEHFSCSSDSSEDEDCYGRPKPPRPVQLDSKGRKKLGPSYYYDADYDAAAGDRKSKHGRRGGMKGVPVFEPTMAEFAEEGGFYGYIKRIEKYGQRAGIVKVIPPKEWTGGLPKVDAPLKPIRLREPIAQHVTGSQGLYRVTNVAKSRIWNAAQWKEAAEQPKWAAPDFLGESKKVDRTDRVAAGPKRRKHAHEDGEAEGTEGSVEGEVEKAGEADGEDEAGERAPSPPARRTRPPRAASAAGAQVLGTTLPVPGASLVGADSPAKVKRPSPLQRAEPTEEEWAAFVDRYEELPHGMKKEDYTVELMREVERRYWRTLTFGEPAMYGADMKGSLFDDSTKAWNVAHLGDLLPRLAPASCKIPGVVSPYLYFGMWRATFAWHVEDADLYSINYIHFGAPKFWYSVPQEQAQKFERVMEGFFPTDRSKCSQFLRHKSFLASPRILESNGITLNRVAHMPGEFILTYPKGYHSGFNLGYNCAESINFATERWIELGKTAKACTCIGDSVNIDVDEWLAEAAEEEAKQKALAAGMPWPPPEKEPTPPPAEPTPPPPPPPPTKIKADPESVPTTNQDPTEAKPKPAPKPRKPRAHKAVAQPLPAGPPPALPPPQHSLPPPHDPLNVSLDRPSVLHGQPQGFSQMEQRMPPIPMPPTQAMRPHVGYPYPPPPMPHHLQHSLSPLPPSFSQSPAPPSALASSPAPAIKPVAKPAAPAKPKKAEFVCALCPDRNTDGLVRVADPGPRGKQIRAHKVCVMFTPTTWIDTDEQSGEEVVRGYATIEKARWRLKCQLCEEKHGVKVQCVRGKCAKAFHVTCAMYEGSGVALDATVVDGGKEVSLLEQVKAEQAHGVDHTSPRIAVNALAPAPVASAAGFSGDVPMDGVATTGDALDEAPAKEDDAAVKLTILCRLHNPAQAARESARRSADLLDKVAALKPNQRISVRTTGGVFEVEFVANVPESEAIAVVHDGGKRNEVKWTKVVWPDSAEEKAKKEEAAAKRKREEEMYVYEEVGKKQRIAGEKKVKVPKQPKAPKKEKVLPAMQAMSMSAPARTPVLSSQSPPLGHQVMHRPGSVPAPGAGVAYPPPYAMAQPGGTYQSMAPRPLSGHHAAPSAGGYSHPHPQQYQHLQAQQQYAQHPQYQQPPQHPGYPARAAYPPPPPAWAQQQQQQQQQHYTPASYAHQSPPPPQLVQQQRSGSQPSSPQLLQRPVPVPAGYGAYPGQQVHHQAGRAGVYPGYGQQYGGQQVQHQQQQHSGQGYAAQPQGYYGGQPQGGQRGM